MNKKNILTVFIYLVICGALVAALSVWLGPEKNSNTVNVSDQTPTTEERKESLAVPEEISNTKDVNEKDSKTKEQVEPFIAPLSPAELQAYKETMTNESNPVAEVKTNLGTFKLELFEDTMPITAGNFIKLAESGFYNGVLFHRVIPNFMIQGGDPLTKAADTSRYGTGGPGYAIPDEHIKGEYLTNIRGTISMANSGPNSGGSQFFINVADNTNLDFDKQPLSSKHPVFGRVISGMDVVDEIALVERNQRDLPLKPVVMESVTITR
jgi:cyclophilin family peptidyl-prolyl cis-trans isomerase